MRGLIDAPLADLVEAERRYGSVDRAPGVEPAAAFTARVVAAVIDALPDDGHRP